MREQKTVARAHRRPKWAPHYGAQVDLGLAQNTQAMLRLAKALLRLRSGLLRLCSGILTLSSGQSSSCSRLQTKTEPAKGKINTESRGIEFVFWELPYDYNTIF